jgi:hypothetical protein
MRVIINDEDNNFDVFVTKAGIDILEGENRITVELDENTISIKVNELTTYRIQRLNEIPSGAKRT